jgi:hypothetical protein
LEKLGTEYVRLKIIGFGGGHTSRVSMIGGFDAGEMRRGDIEDWLAETSAKESAEKAKQLAATLKWARIAGWAAIASVGVTIIVALIK